MTLTLRFHGQQRRGVALLGSLAITIVVGLASLMAVGVINKRFAETRYTHGVNVVARFELKIPASTPIVIEDGPLRVDLVADREERQAFFSDKVSRPEGTHQIVRGAVWLVKPTTQRTLVVSIAGEPKRVVRLDLPAKPKASEEFGPWQRLDTEPASPPGAAAYEIRYHAN